MALCGALVQPNMTSNPAIAPRLQSRRPVRRVAELGSLCEESMNCLRRFVPGRRLFRAAVGRGQRVPPGLFVLRRDAHRAGPSSAPAAGDTDRWRVFSGDPSGACLAHGRNRITRRSTQQPGAARICCVLISRCSFRFLIALSRLWVSLVVRRH